MILERYYIMKTKITKLENKCFGSFRYFLMAAYSMFGFHFLLSSFTLLVLAAAHFTDECSKHEHCGYLGRISFPFTTSSNRECGLQINGCEDDHIVKTIKLTDKEEGYKIDNIFSNDWYHSIFIHYPDFDAVLPPEPLKKPFEIKNNITFYRCIRNSNQSLIPPNMSLYRNCPYQDIYFSPSEPVDPDSPLPMPNLPFACFLVQFLSFGPVTIPNYPSCAFLFSSLEIEVLLPPSCEFCSRRHPCKFDEHSLNCVHHYVDKDINKPPPQKTAHSKDKNAMKIGLSVGIPSLVAVAALFVIFFIFKQRNKYSGLKTQPGNTYSGSFRNTTIRESGVVYFGILVFSYEELREATNNFDQARQLGEGGFGTVYYGMLRDGREVAVKRLFERNYRPVESFINEIQILTRLHHRNLVSLYGCTSRHSRELLLVYEYVPNGTVNSHLHDDQAKPCKLSWPMRMKIAIETAGALAYLHASDIVHRDVKTSNILLDNDFGVKVADFGLSRLFPDDATHVSTAPRGTPGYVDPDYRICYQLTTKSDVYSFGVVLVELISSLKAFDMNRSRDDIKLANLAIRKIQKGEFCELVDPSLGFQSDEKLKGMIVSVAELAFRCLQGDKELRPSMSEVLEVLQIIESGRDEPGKLEGIEVQGSRASQSYAHPPLPNSFMKPQQRLHQTH